MQANFDQVVARQRIREIAAQMALSSDVYQTPSAISSGYHDVDRASPFNAFPSSPQSPAYRDNDYAPHTSQRVSSDLKSSSFEDLDLLPLEEKGDQPTSSVISPVFEEARPPLSADSPSVELPSTPESQPLEPPVMRHIIFLATTRSGGVAPFGRTQPNLDGQGLRYGIGRFTQVSGQLGRLLQLFQERDRESFAQIFGPDSAFPEADPEALLRVTNAPDGTPGIADHEQPRLQSVGGRPLWDPAWIQRFKAAAQHTPFQDMQFRLVAESYLLPLLPFARNLGLATERGLAILSERAIQLGVERARAFVIAAAGPINTDALRHAALQQVAVDPNQATLADFQTAEGVEEPSGQFGPLTHAALVAAVRRKSGDSLALISTEMMLDQIVQAATQSELPGLVSEIRQNPNLNDAPFSEAPPVMQ